MLKFDLARIFREYAVNQPVAGKFAWVFAFTGNSNLSPTRRLPNANVL